NKKVDTLDKFVGLKARTSGLIQTKTLEALGASPMTIAGTELAPALIRGTVDAVTTSLTYGWSQGFPDITSYAALWPITPGYFFSIIMNAKKFDSLPPDLQKVVLDVTNEIARQQIFAMNSQLATVIKAIGLTKCEIVYPAEAEINKAKDKVKGVRDEYVKVSGPVATDLLKAVDEAVAKYRTVIKSMQ
ncbi:MAG: TRAP transporter substrate-binding protein DctP, partial [Chloroflexota bacterium]|nr:TRAP transporter substrate-binding protein DctP [Chloroflexota bacterium]